MTKDKASLLYIGTLLADLTLVLRNPELATPEQRAGLIAEGEALAVAMLKGAFDIGPAEGTAIPNCKTAGSA